jgi:hypothetical protein
VKEKNLLPLPGFETLIVQPAAQSLYRLHSPNSPHRKQAKVLFRSMLPDFGHSGPFFLDSSHPWFICSYYQKQRADRALLKKQTVEN